MIALLIIAASFIFGLTLVRVFRLELNFLEKISTSIILGVVGFTWIAFLLSELFGFDLGITLAISFVMGIAVLSLKKPKNPVTPLRFSKRQVFVYLAHTLFWGGLFLILLYTHMLQRKSDGIYSGGNTWGDLALHATFINKFATQGKIDLVSPIYAQTKTTYPFLFDFFTSILYRYGFTVQLSLITSSFLFLFAFLQLAYFLVVKMFRSHLAAFLFPFIFLLNGGIGVYYFFVDYQASGKSFLDFLFSMPIGYANLFVHHIYWSNLIADYILPQRGFIPALGLFTVFILLLWKIYKARETKRPEIWLIGLILGSLPFFHVHTFLVSSGILFWFLVLTYFHQPKKIMVWIPPIILTAIMVVPQLYWQFSHTFGHGFARLQLGWMKGTENFFSFWIRNMGLEFIIFVVGSIYLFWKRHEQSFLFRLLVPVILLFGLINIFVFQPYDYDNTKFLVYGHYILSLLAIYLMVKLKSRWGNKSWLMIVPVVILMTITGFLSTLRETYLSWRIADNNDLALAQFIKEKTSSSSIFLTSDSHNHPVTMLAGRSILMGYRGWLWTHGINYNLTERDVLNMFTGLPITTELLRQYKVSYVFIGPAELNEFRANKAFFQAHYPVIFANESGTIFDVRGAPAPTVAKEK